MNWRIAEGRTSSSTGSPKGKPRWLRAAGLSLAALALTAGGVAFGQLDGPQDALSAAGVTWNFGNTNGVRRPPLSVVPEGEADRSVPGFGLDDASLNALGPAVDTSATLWINGFQFATDTFSTVNGVLTAGPAVTQGVSVTITHGAVINAPMLRSLISLTNNSGSTVTLNQIEWIFSEVGGDGNATQATSSGDTIFTVADRWTVSSDTDGTTSPSVPAVLYALYGPGSPALTTATVANRVYQVGAPSNNQAGMKAVFGPLSIPAGTTKRLLFFTGLYPSNGNAVGAAAAFGQPTSCVFYGIPANQLAEIVNWSLSPSSQATQCLLIKLPLIQRP